jgi:hypothetical protein
VLNAYTSPLIMINDSLKPRFRFVFRGEFRDFELACDQEALT